MAAFIDVIGPPYNDGDRTCTYYRLGEAADPAHDQLWLHHDQPDFYCEHILYTGPRIDERLLA